MSRFFEKISAVKHKYKLEFTLIKLSMEMPLTEELSIVVKRGDHKKQSEKRTLKKGKIDFKEVLTFDQVTMFYNNDSKKYIEKEGEIRLVIHTEKGDKKLGGVIKFDVAEYVNEKLEYKKEEKYFEKCPEKAKNTKLTYEVFVKFIGESYSETGSEIGGITKPLGTKETKDTKDKKKKTNQSQNELKSGELEGDPQANDKKKPIVHYDPEDEEPEPVKKKTKRSSVDDRKVQQKPKLKVLATKKIESSEEEDDLFKKLTIEPKKKDDRAETKVSTDGITYKKASSDEEQEEPQYKVKKGDQRKDKREKKEEKGEKKEEKAEKKEDKAEKKTGEQTDRKDKADRTQKIEKVQKPEKVKQKPLPEQKPPKQDKPSQITYEPPVDPYQNAGKSTAGLRPTFRTQKATEQYYEERLNKLENELIQVQQQRDTLKIQVNKLNHTLNSKEKELKQSKKQTRTTKDESSRVRQLQQKVNQLEKQRGSLLVEHEALKNKLSDMKDKEHEDKDRLKSEVEAIEQQFKKSMKKMKEQLAETKQKMQKLQKDRKDLEKDKASYKKEIQARNVERKEMEARVKTAQDELAKVKIMISEAINSASEQQDQKLTQFLQQHFM